MKEHVDLPALIAGVLAPHMGVSTADAAARHLCAKHGVGDGPLDPARTEQLRETLRRGLVAFVGAEKARTLADRCLGGPPGAA
jgi:hypothetical protein